MHPNIIKMENYVQQFDGASLNKHGSLLIGLAFFDNKYLQVCFIYKISSPIYSLV